MLQELLCRSQVIWVRLKAFLHVQVDTLPVGGGLQSLLIMVEFNHQEMNIRYKAFST
jgi:hypothetical protein